MEQHAFINVDCFNTNIYSYLETSGGQSSNLYLKVLFTTPVPVRHLCELKTVVFLHWRRKYAVLLFTFLNLAVPLKFIFFNKIVGGDRPRTIPLLVQH